jgi:ech hydrogenase subunit C
MADGFEKLLDRGYYRRAGQYNSFVFYREVGSMAFLKKSPWLIHYDASSCNGCDIEVLACLTPLYDVERLGIINTGNPKHADIFLVTGSVNEQNKEVIQNIYTQMPDPKVVVAIGICATSGGIFSECYNVSGGVDKIIPVDVYVPGCAARPESIIDGIIASLSILEVKYKKLQGMASGIEEIGIRLANIKEAQEILALQKLAYQSEAEIYNDYSLAPLTQTLEELKEDFGNKVFLKAVMNKQLIGSVRGYLENNTCYISRLMVNPLYQNLGIGRKLLGRIERYFHAAKRYEVFTWHDSKRNIFFYKKNGYKMFKREKLSEIRDSVFLEKINKKVKT